jgi:heme oxygenase
MGLREATAELHRKAEKMEFNQRMMNNKLTIEEYVSYLESQYSIFEKIERLFTLPDPGLARSGRVLDDLYELGETTPNVSDKTMEYIDYLSTLNNYSILPHIYLNYLALAFGGQMIKTKIHGSGRMYDFDDIQTSVGSIRRHQRDDWADEVNKGFEFIINILDELQNTTKRNS